MNKELFDSIPFFYLPSPVVVFVAAVGIRKEGDKKDIYSLARKLFRLRLLGETDL